MNVALITGITGQDGACLAESLLEKGCEMHGIKRRSSLFNTDRIDYLMADEHGRKNPRLTNHYGGLSDSTNLIRIIQEVQPDEIYNLGAMSHVKVSFDAPEYVANVDGVGTLRILEAVRLLGLTKKTKVYQASTSELYGLVQEVPQRETMPFYPRSPYAVAKLYGYWITVNYREAYGMFAVNGIPFNHESPPRGETFVTRKIRRGVAQIVLGMRDDIALGTLDARRDWGHAKDYAEALWRLLHQDEPEDFVIATGTTTVREFVRLVFAEVGVEVAFEGEGVHETGRVLCSVPVVPGSGGHGGVPCRLGLLPRHGSRTAHRRPGQVQGQAGLRAQVRPAGPGKRPDAGRRGAVQARCLLLKGSHKVNWQHEHL